MQKTFESLKDNDIEIIVIAYLLKHPDLIDLHFEYLDISLFGDKHLPIQNNFYYHKNDLRDESALKNIILNNKIDTVLHLACISNDPTFELNNNISKEIINSLNKVKPPFNVSRPALYAASAAIKDSLWLNKEIKHVNKWNKKMFNEFKKMKIETNKSYSNFLLVNFDRVKINSSKVFKQLAKTGILVRKMDVYGIKNSLRITIGKSDENRKLISKMKKILNV